MSLVVFTGFVGLAVAPGHLHPVLAAIAVLCIAVGAGASGAINMWYDRDIDAVMRRTAMRPLPAGRMMPGEALGFGCVLAVGSVAAGALMATSVKDWLNPLFGSAEPEAVHMGRWAATGLTVLLTLAGAGLGVALFRNGTALEEQPAGPVVTAARNNLYADAFNEAVFEMPGKYLTRALVYFDSRGVDGLVNGLAATVGGGSGRLRRLQTGCAVVRPVDTRRCATRGGGNAGGDARMSERQRANRWLSVWRMPANSPAREASRGGPDHSSPSGSEAMV